MERWVGQLWKDFNCMFKLYSPVTKWKTKRVYILANFKCHGAHFKVKPLTFVTISRKFIVSYDKCHANKNQSIAYLLTQVVAESEPICPRWSSAVLGRKMSYTKILSPFVCSIESNGFWTTSNQLLDWFSQKQANWNYFVLKYTILQMCRSFVRWYAF